MKLKLVHGTSAEYLEQIKAEGLVPRNLSPSRWETCPSHPEWVYLTDAYALYYAMNAALPDNDCLLVEVEVDTDNFYPDEDFLGQATGDSPHLPDNIEARTQSLLEWSQTIDHNLRAELASKSLKGLGTVAHAGPIKADQIQRMIVIPQEDISRIVVREFDPVICLANYAIMGAKYQRLQLEFFERYAESPLS